jgi:hypothetical protein
MMQHLAGAFFAVRRLLDLIVTAGGVPKLNASAHRTSYFTLFLNAVQDFLELGQPLSEPRPIGNAVGHAFAPPVPLPSYVPDMTFLILARAGRFYTHRLL